MLKKRSFFPGGRAVCFEDEDERLNPEKILREVVLKRCPNLEELHLEGFDLSELESDELPASIHGLSYDAEGLWEQGPSFAKRDLPRGSENKFLRRVTIRRLPQPSRIVEDRCVTSKARSACNTKSKQQISFPLFQFLFWKEKR